MKVLIEYPKKGNDVVKVSVSWMDLVDMYQTIARLLYPLFKKYRATYNKNKPIGSFPLSMTEGICDPYAMSDEDEAACLEKWLSMLDKILYAFKALADYKIGWDGPQQADMAKECIKLQKTAHAKKRIKLARLRDITEREANPGKSAYRSYEMEEEIEICKPIYDMYQPLFDEHKKRVQEGLDLFAKHFGSFWY
jgi:hypothetical protein